MYYVFKSNCTGEFVAVGFENSWYPGEIVKITTEDKAEINFMCHTATRSKTFIWPKINNICM